MANYRTTNLSVIHTPTGLLLGLVNGTDVAGRPASVVHPASSEVRPWHCGFRITGSGSCCADGDDARKDERMSERAARPTAGELPAPIWAQLIISRSMSS